MIVDAQYVYTCAACGAQEIERWKQAIGCEPLRPGCPHHKGWIDVEGKLYCPKHRIEVRINIDGHDLPPVVYQYL